MVDAGAQCVYVVDSAGALVLSDAQERIQAVLDEIGRDGAQVGFHGHQNLSLGIANSVLAYQAGAKQIDGRCAPSVPGGQRSPTEVLAATFERMGIKTGVDLGEVLSAAEDVVRPFIPRLPWMDRASITQGYAGVYSRSSCTPSAPPPGTTSRPRHPPEGRRVRVRRRPGGHDHRHRLATPAGAGLGDLAGMGCADGAVDRESVAVGCSPARTSAGTGPVHRRVARLDLDTGYRIQDRTLAMRLARGEKLIGVKLGLTSRAKQQRMGVHFPFVAWLTDAMVLPVGDPVPQGRLIHPRIEPEIVFVMGRRLEGPGVTCAQAMAAVESVWGGAEVIDSRYRDFRFTAGDVAADNASSGRLRHRTDRAPTCGIWTSPWRACSSRSTGSSSTPPPAPRCRATGRGARAGRQRPGPPRPRHRGRLDRPSPGDDRRGLCPPGVSVACHFHHARLGLPQRRW